MPSIEIPGFGRVGMQQIVGAILAAIAVVGALVGVTTGSSKGAGSRPDDSHVSSPTTPSTAPNVVSDTRTFVGTRKIDINPSFKERLGFNEADLDRVTQDVERQSRSFIERAGGKSSVKAENLAAREHKNTPELSFTVGDEWAGELTREFDGGRTRVRSVRWPILDIVYSDDSFDDIPVLKTGSFEYGFEISHDDNFIYFTEVRLY